MPIKSTYVYILSRNCYHFIRRYFTEILFYHYSIFYNVYISKCNLILYLSKNSKSKLTVISCGDLVYAINNLFWWRVVESDKWKFKILSNGSLRSTDLFHINRLTYFLYHKYGVGLGIAAWYTVFLILCLGFIFHGTYWSILIAILVLATPIIQSAIYVVSRYHSPSWIGHVLLLIALKENITTVAAVTLGWSMVTSSTTFFICSFISLTFSLLYNHGLFYILAPSVLIFFWLHFLINKTKLSIPSVSNIFRIIGILKNSKYKRQQKESNNNLIKWVTLSYGFFIILSFTFGSIQIFTCFSLLLYFANQYLLRFCDRQTVEVNLVLSSTIDMLYSENIALFLLPFIWSIHTPSMYAKLPAKNKYTLPLLKPIDLNNVINVTHDLFHEIKIGEKVYFCLPNPGNRYENLFSQGRQIVELLHYVCTKKGIISFPDWYMVMNDSKKPGNNLWSDCIDDLKLIESNYQPDFILTISNNIKSISRKYVLLKTLNLNDHIPHSTLKSSSYLKIPNLILYKKKLDQIS